MNFGKMIQMAEVLSRNIDFVRVDFYDTERRPLIGELTMTPGGGVQSFSDPAIDKFLGSCWKQSLSSGDTF